MNRIRDFFAKNLLWKLFALLIAIMLWITGININNPIDTRTFEVSLRLDNENELTERDGVLMNKAGLEQQRIKVQIRARVQELDSLDTSLIKASINLGLIENLASSASGKLWPTGVSVESPYDIVGVSPLTVDVQIDSIKSTQRRINIDTVNEPAEDFVTMTPVLSPDFITITGAQTLLGTISSVRAEVNVSGATADVKQTVKVNVYDMDNKIITTGIKLSGDFIEVVVPVLKKVRVPIVLASEYTGIPAPEHIVVSITNTTADYVEVIGPAEDLEALQRLPLNPVDVSGADKSFYVTEDLRKYLKPSLSIVNGTPNEVVLRVEVENLERRDVLLNTFDFDIIDEFGRECLFTDEEITVTLIGKSEVLEALNIQTLNPQVDITGLSVGVQQANVNFTLPESVIPIGGRVVIQVEIMEPVEE